MKKMLAMAMALAVCVSAWAAPAYVELKPQFVVNYGEGSRLRYLKAEVTLRTRDPMSAHEIHKHADYLRHELVLLLSRQTVQTVSTAEGKEALRDAALKAVQEVLLRETGQVLVDQVLFTNFIVQR